MNQEEQLPTSTQELAAQRTAWAMERTRLATERTLIAWLRTGLALIGFGAIVPRVLDGIEPEWLVGLIASLFVIFGTVVAAIGVHTYREMSSRLDESERGISWGIVVTLAAAIEVCAILILVMFLLA
jgi:putative membrane protein